MLTAKRIYKGTQARVSRMLCRWQSVGSSLPKTCNACGKGVARFYSYGDRPFGCPFCQASPRERLVDYCLDKGLLSPPGKDFLHVAPSESSLIKKFGKLDGYLPVDLFPDLYPLTNTQRMDLMELSDENRFDVVYLSHVMEHVPDDIAVLKNLYRSLKPGGQGWFLVPLSMQPTVDGAMNLSGRERERRFGQWDHMRQYGPDFADRLAQVGFNVKIIKVEEFPAEDQAKFGLNAEDWVFYGTKDEPR